MTLVAVARKVCLVCALGAVAFLVAASASPVAPAALAGTSQTCAGVPDGSTQTAPTPGHPCWVAADPYPFGADGNPVDPTSDLCLRTPAACYLDVTSMAFRAWNRGLAATTSPSSSRNPFGVWIFNGTRWYPDPTFPGSSVCQGNTILWAGKLDYWLIGTGQNGWAPLCRFDGSDFLWEPLPMPEGTILRLGNSLGQLPAHGGITSGSCLAWDNCWFFGTDDTVLHWDGDVLTDVSPDAPATWAGTTFTAAQLSAGSGGSAVGLATVGTSYVFDTTAGIPIPTRAAMPTQMFSFDGTTANGSRLAGSVLTSTIYHAPMAVAAANTSADPFGTDPVAVSLDPSGNGWLAANPAAWQVGAGIPFLRPDLDAPERSPLVPVSTGPGNSTGRDPGCPSWLTSAGLDRFPHTYAASGPTPGSTLWTSISSFPGGNSALAGGQAISTLSDGSPAAEPVIVQARCDGTTTTTRFRIPDPTGSATTVPADEGGSVAAIAANAPNDGWAATSAGMLPKATIAFQPPELYRFTDGTAPKAPAGNDNEVRQVTVQQNPPTYIYEPPPPPKLPPLPRPSTTKNVSPPIGAIHRRIVRAGHAYTLVLSFKVRQRVVLGLDAFRHSSLIASTGLKEFHPPSGELRLSLNPKRWPTRLGFSSNKPQVTLRLHGRGLSGTAALSATATAIDNTRIKSVQFQYELSGSGYWFVIGSAKKLPYGLSFDTKDVANGTYELRALATDTRGGTGISRPIAVSVRNAR